MSLVYLSSRHPPPFPTTLQEQTHAQGVLFMRIYGIQLMSPFVIAYMEILELVSKLKLTPVDTAHLRLLQTHALLKLCALLHPLSLFLQCRRFIKYSSSQSELTKCWPGIRTHSITKLNSGWPICH